jgi:hypothetical protein
MRDRFHAVPIDIRDHDFRPSPRHPRSNGAPVVLGCTSDDYYLILKQAPHFHDAPLFFRYKLINSIYANTMGVSSPNDTGTED